MDKGHSSSSHHNSGHTKAPEPLQIARNVQGLEGSFSQNQEESSVHPKEGHRRSTSMKPGTPPPKDLDPSKKTGTHANQGLHRMKSDGEALSKNTEKGPR